MKQACYHYTTGPPGSDINKLSFTVLSKMTDLQSARGPQIPFQSQSMPAGINQQAIILPNVCQTSIQAESIINQPSVILPSVGQSIFNNNHLFRQNTYLQNKKHTLTCQGGTGCYRFNYQPGS